MVNTCIRGADVAKSICSVPACERVSDVRGLCPGHYRRFRLTGDTRAAEPLAPRDYSPLEVRFWAKVDATGDCWEWTGYRQSGYGVFMLPRDGGPVRRKQAHRFAWELLVGEIPAGLQLDHRCQNPACVNPAHLDPVTPRVNVLRSPVSASGAALRRVSCPQGHPYDRLLNGKHRRCSICLAANDKRSRAGKVDRALAAEQKVADAITVLT
jgi:hypothetical protein